MTQFPILYLVAAVGFGVTGALLSKVSNAMSRSAGQHSMAPGSLHSFDLFTSPRRIMAHPLVVAAALAVGAIIAAVLA